MLGLERLRWPEWVIGAGGAVLLGSLLGLPWYHTPGRTIDGWQGLAHLRWLLLAAVVLALATALLQASRRAPAVPATVTLFAAVLGAVSVLLLIYRVLADPPGGSRQAGGFVALAATLAIAYGGWRSLRRDGIADRDAPSDIPIIDPFSQARS